MTRFSAERPSHVRISTGARIHLGFYGLCRSHGRILGGMGLAVDGVGYTVKARAGRDGVTGCQSHRVREILEKAVNDLNALPGPVSVKVETCIPEHVGLGSTTQLTLAIYAAVGLLAGKSIRESVEVAARGPYSGIGVGTFLYGGFIVDAGVRIGSRLARPVFRAEFPSEWRIVAVIPETEWRVAEGPKEDAMVELPEGSKELCSRAMEALLRLIAPGIAEKDFDLFTNGVEMIQRLTGEYFSGVQGGLYCCSESEEAARLIHSLGGRGVGQSSWGPLVYGFFPSEEKALKAYAGLVERYGEERVLLLRPRNRGAVVEAN
ncbi:hypothetical protein [Hyperthermus butylicus]|nr:hypothetical protein [Hyperthermus butylicus]